MCVCICLFVFVHFLFVSMYVYTYHWFVFFVYMSVQSSVACVHVYKLLLTVIFIIIHYVIDCKLFHET